MAQQKRKTQSRRDARRQAERRTPSSGVAGRLVIMLAIVAAVVFGVAIFFKVSHVEVQGNSLYSAEQIVAASGIEVGDNLLTLNKETVAGNIIAQLPYVEKVSIGRSMPDAVILDVTESTATFAVATDTNTIWLINASGKALERYDGGATLMQAAEAAAEQAAADGRGEVSADTPADAPPHEIADTATDAAADTPAEAPETDTAGTDLAGTADDANAAADSADTAADMSGTDDAADETQFTQSGVQAQALAEVGVPYILGVTVNNPTAGTQVTASNQQALNAALSVLAAFDGTGLTSHVAYINVEKDYNIVVQYDDQYSIELGGTDKLDYKVQYLLAILEQLSEYQAGTIDLTLTEENVARFHPKA